MILALLLSAMLASTSAGTGTLQDFGPAPELRDISGWINSKPLAISRQRGKVVLLKFWTFSCVNCVHTLPATQQWYDRFHDQGLEIIAVHTPELPDERVPANIARAVQQRNITYPVALDPKFATWNAYRNHYWPALYLIDARGHIRYTHIGEGAYAETEQAIQRLLRERKPQPEPPPHGVLPR